MIPAPMDYDTTQAFWYLDVGIPNEPDHARVIMEWIEGSEEPILVNRAYWRMKSSLNSEEFRPDNRIAAWFFSPEAAEKFRLFILGMWSGFGNVVVDERVTPAS